MIYTISPYYTSEVIADILARDISERNGQGGVKLTNTIQKVEGTKPTRKYTVVFEYDDGSTKEFS